MALIEDAGPLIRHEVTTGAPASPLEDLDESIVKRGITFNPGLVYQDFQIADEQLAILARREDEIVEGIAGYREAYDLLPRFLEELKGLRPGSKPAVVERIREEIATEREIVATLYDRIRPDRFPSTAAIDERWAIYRWAQVRLLDAVDTIGKYGEAGRMPESKQVNAHIDIDYTILAALAGGLASRDKVVIRRFHLLRPDGVLVT